MKTHICPNFSALTITVAEWMTQRMQDILSRKPCCTLVLSGGSTPRALYVLLASPPYRDRVDWSRVHVFWGDERYVPFEDDRNNARMAFDTLLDNVPVKKEHIHRMRTDIDAEQSAVEYEKMLRTYFEEEGKSFDLVLLGMGNDAHTLSLFPHQPVIFEKKDWVKALYLQDQAMFRITLTAPIVNRSHCICFLVSGAEKAAALSHVLGEEIDPELYPSQVIRESIGELHLFVDEAAAADLPIA